MKALLATVLSGLLLVSMAVSAEVRIREQQVQFEKGESAATLKGTLRGDQIVDYRLRASAGQPLVVVLKSSNPSLYFNVLPADSDVALFVGSTSGNRFEAELPDDGVYTIRVYLMRSAARRNEGAIYTLDLAVAGEPGGMVAGVGPVAADSAAPATWDAEGKVKCSAGSDAFHRQCEFRVVRDLARQAADIWVGNVANRKADYRYLHYENQAFTTNDKSKLGWYRKQDNWWVSVDGREFYLIPDAVIHGG